jgi:hypothetical protein
VSSFLAGLGRGVTFVFRTRSWNEARSSRCVRRSMTCPGPVMQMQVQMHPANAAAHAGANAMRTLCTRIRGHRRCDSTVTQVDLRSTVVNVRSPLAPETRASSLHGTQGNA